jgi:hypothetical protein
MVKLSAMKTTRAWISSWRDALWSNPSGWLVLLLVGLLYGLAKLRLLPLELGFAGSAAIVLAAYFLCRDAFRTDLPLNEGTDTVEKNTPVPTERRWALMAAAAAVLVFVMGASVYYASREDRLRQVKRNLTPEQLSASTRPDTEVDSVWITFQSAAGYSYRAKYVFDGPEGPYILLDSTDDQREDFERVSAQLAQSYGGTAKGDNDIGDVIQVSAGFTQKGIAAKLTEWFATTFKNSKIEVVYYKSESK